MTRVIKRRNIPQDFVEFLKEYLQSRSMRERNALIENRHKAVLMDVLSQAGVPQEGGHRTLPLDEPLSYYEYKTETPRERKIVGIERKYRAGSMTLQEEPTLELLQSKGLTERCTTTITVVNEDEILAANYDGLISDEELKTLYVQADPTYAFYLTYDD